ncbi:hypothetical protein U0070_002939 [Myodes glareolus]|uniref:Uncharacterized protein n=1 Tax=Myodes glareolus TaxID=447135 RepID=A0AAW0HKV3_MYOGA
MVSLRCGHARQTSPDPGLFTQCVIKGTSVLEASSAPVKTTYGIWKRIMPQHPENTAIFRFILSYCSSWQLEEAKGPGNELDNTKRKQTLFITCCPLLGWRSMSANHALLWDFQESDLQTKCLML